ncbi:MAG: DUF1848 domain-containing protein [Rhodospirillales bacterium]|nr:DUF1848 domain-containing protein [Rhodospirillales bacterium]
MIISASYKTDIPAFYGPWFMNRLEAGFCRMVNPYGGQVYKIPLDRENVDGFVFWTRNLGPFLDNLSQVHQKCPFTIQYTITGYPKALDYATIATNTAIFHLKEVKNRFGPHAGVWRYDPVVFTSLTPPAWHLENFTGLAQKLEGVVDEVVLSFAQIYRKTSRNMTVAARAFDFDWSDEGKEVKQSLLQEFVAIANQYGIRPTLCAQPDLLIEGVGETACIDAARLARMSGVPFPAKRKPHRKECGCWQSKDIGDYDTCPHGCTYCYAVQSRTLAKKRFQAHDPKGEFLFARG